MISTFFDFTKDEQVDEKRVSYNVNSPMKYAELIRRLEIIENEYMVGLNNFAWSFLKFLNFVYHIFLGPIGTHETYYQVNEETGGL